jgi:hypothetical protein
MSEIRGRRNRPSAGIGRLWIGLMAGAVAMLSGCRGEVDAGAEGESSSAAAPSGANKQAGGERGRRSAGDSVVLVVMQSGTFEQVLPGFVARSDGENAYVVVGGRHERMLHETKEDTPRPAEEVAFSVIWGREPQYHRVKARAIGNYRERGLRIVAAPAAEMPPPLPTGPAPRIAESAPVKLDGFQWLSGQGRRRAFARAVEDGVIATIEPRRRDEDTADDLYIEGPNVANINFGVATTADGVAVATFTEFANPYNREDAQTVVGVPIEQLDAALSPEIQMLLAAPRKGDAKSIEYEFLLWMEAPAGKADSVRLFVKRSIVVDDGPSGRQPADRRRTPFAKDAAELKLVQEKPSGEVLAQNIVPPQFQKTTPWIARHVDANPGPGGFHVFDVQLAVQRPDGSWSYSQPHRVGCEMRGSVMREGAIRPDIPGPDGRPFDPSRPPGPFPKPVAADPFAPPSKELAEKSFRELRDWVDTQAPAPRNVKRLFQGETKEVSGAKFTSLVVKGDRPAGLAFSDDGQAAIIASATGLVRISLADFRTAVELDLPGWSPSVDGSTLRIGKEGLLLRGSVRSSGRSKATGEQPTLLVVDPNTLRIKRAFCATGSLHASPSSSSCFLTLERNVSLIDLASATVTDMLTSETFVQRVVAVEPRAESEARQAAQWLTSALLSGDGQTAITSGTLWNVRQGRLTFRQFLPNAPRMSAVSATGDPDYFAVYDTEDCCVYSVQNPAKPAFRVPVLKGGSSPFVMVPARKRLYLLNNNLLGVLDYQGKERAILTLPERDALGGRLAASRDGKRLLIGSMRGLYLVTLPDSL